MPERLSVRERQNEGVVCISVTPGEKGTSDDGISLSGALFSTPRKLYSYRKALNGSTRVARRAGTYAAAIATAASTAVAAP